MRSTNYHGKYKQELIFLFTDEYGWYLIQVLSNKMFLMLIQQRAHNTKIYDPRAHQDSRLQLDKDEIGSYNRHLTKNSTIFLYNQTVKCQESYGCANMRSTKKAFPVMAHACYHIIRYDSF